MKKQVVEFIAFILFSFLPLGFPASSARISAQTVSPPAKSSRFINGRWFDGKVFRRRVFYSADGALTLKKPARIDQTIDLKNGYVIPPFGEGHNHWIEPQAVDDYIRNYLRDGVFYVKDEANFPWVVTQFRDKLNRPTSVDFVTALQGFTGRNGHPLEVVRQFQEIGVLPKEWTENDFDGKTVFVIEDAQDIPRRWAEFLKGKPDFVKVFLNYSEAHGKHLDDPKKTGLDPRFLPEIVRLAHEAGLEVSVHISTARDFHHAVASGADEIAHLPFVDFDKKYPDEHFLISEADARLAARRNVRAITTLSWLAADFADDPPRAAEARQKVIVPNLKRLKRAGVRLFVGSDQFRGTVVPEILLISKFDVFSNLELLKIACETTPQMIFPKRRIGFLREGYEASFLVLGGNPLINLEEIKNIKMRFKQGYEIETPQRGN